MKKINLITSVALIASLGLVGCGGGGNVDGTAQTTNSISGTAIDPELQGATICLDLNQDENCTEGEPTTSTDENGTFNLTVSDTQLEGYAPLLAIGGIDKESGEEFKGKLLADVNEEYQNITPLTTLTYERIKADMGKSQEVIQSGMADIEKLLNLTSNEIQANIITLAEEGNTNAMKVALSLQKSAEAINPEDPIRFYENLSQEITSSKAKSLIDSILNITPTNLKNQVHSLVVDIMDSEISYAYAMSEEVRMRAKELGIDQEEIMAEMPYESNIPEEGNNTSYESNIPNKSNTSNESNTTAGNVTTGNNRPSIPSNF